MAVVTSLDEVLAVGGAPVAGSGKQQSEVMRQLEEALRLYTQPDSDTMIVRLVDSAYADAASFRAASGVDDKINKADAAVAGMYLPGEINADDPDIYSNITNTKVRAGRAWLLDILANAMDKPWVIEPTPIAELPPEAEEAAITAVINELADIAGVDPSALTPEALSDSRAADVMRQIKELAITNAQALAKAAAERIERKIDDQLTECNFRAAMDAFLTDMMMYPAGVIRGPYVENIKTLKWVDKVLTRVETPAYRVRRVAPKDFFPAPKATSVDDAPFVIERANISHNDLIASKSLPGFNEVAIDALVNNFRSGTSTDVITGSSGVSVPEYGDSSPPRNEYEVLIYTGLIPADYLSPTAAQPSTAPHVECEAWVSGGLLLRLVQNPAILSERGYYVVPFEPIPGSLWGRSVPDLLRDTQRVCNASLRSLARNMAYASGPIGEYDAARIADEAGVATITPHRMIGVKADAYSPTRQPALRFHVVPSVARELLAIYDHFVKQADDISGIPAYVLGNPQVAGAGRTLGGLSLLMGNAAKGIKALIADIDKKFIEPFITAMYVLNMSSDSVDDADKVDVKIKARGSSGLLQRESAQAKAVEVLQLLTPYAQAGIVPPDSLVYMIREVVAGLGFDPDKIDVDPKRKALLQRVGQGANAAGAATPATAPGTPMPQLDKRSAPPVDPADAERLPAVQ